MDYKVLKQRLIEAGMCEEFRNTWSDISSPGDIFRLALTMDGIDFVTAKKPVEKEDIKTLFSGFLNGNKTQIYDGVYGTMYVDFDGFISDNNDVVSIMGNSIINTGEMRNKAAYFNVADSSFLSITVCENCFIRVSIHDDSTLIVNGLEKNSTLIIKTYGDKCKVLTASNVSRENVKITQLDPLIIKPIEQ